MKEIKTCPNCGCQWDEYWQPGVTADVIAEAPGGAGIYLIERRKFPPGWAIPGGFIEKDESLEETAVREFREETGMSVSLLAQLGTYSRPGRDPRKQTVSTVFVGIASGTPRAGDDAAKVKSYPPDRLPSDIAFDHRTIIGDYMRWKAAREKA